MIISSSNVLCTLLNVCVAFIYMSDARDIVQFEMFQ